MADNREYVYRRLRQELGLTPAQAAGVVGGLGGESGKTLSTTARNPSSGAFGIGQWLGGRLTSLQSKGSPTSLRTQTNHLISELKGPERGALERLRQAHSIRSATTIFVKDFERPSAGEIASSMPARLDYAREAFNQFRGVRGGAADGAAAGGTAGGRGGSTRTTTTITPGQDFGPQRLALVQQFLGDKDSDVLDFAMQARQLQDIPETRTTKTVRIPGAPSQQVAGGGGGGGGAHGVAKITGPNPDRIIPGVKQFMREISAVRGGKPVVGSDGTGHSYLTVNGTVSEHSTGHASDIPARGQELINLGQAALIAAGMPRAEARQKTGGLFNVMRNGRRYQIIFNTQEGGDHTDHLHVGIRGGH